jgi:hypothetical protein
LRYTLYNMIFGDYVNGSIQADYVSGVFAPAEQEFIANDWLLGWSGDYIVQGSIQANDSEDEIVFVLNDSPINLVWDTRINGVVVHESVTVLAGILYPDALRISRKMEMSISVKLQSTIDSLGVDGVLEINSSMWFEPYVGLLKEEVDSANVSYLGMTFLIVLGGKLELMEFRLAE